MRRYQGDTIIEVMLAITIFSSIAIGVTALMGRGVAAAQRSLEITLVRQQIDSQAEMLRFVSDQAKAGSAEAMVLWQDITSHHVMTDPLSVLNRDTCPTAIPGYFSLWPMSSGQVDKAPSSYRAEPATYARVNDAGSEGISIQLARVTGGRAYDAYIQACWYAPGQSRPITTGTVVRIYDEQA